MMTARMQLTLLLYVGSGPYVAFETVLKSRLFLLHILLTILTFLKSVILGLYQCCYLRIFYQ